MNITKLIEDLEEVSVLVDEDEMENAYNRLEWILRELRIVVRREEKISSLDTDQEIGNRE